MNAHSGKLKVSVIRILFRRLFRKHTLAGAPGLILSEETTPLLSIGYRGLNPGRVQFMQVLADGIPIHADQFGYPEAYYTPPLDTVDRVEFVHGGAALMYGPQPGGSLNYITHRPRTDKTFSGETLHTIGNDDAYSSFSHLDGTIGRIGYYGYYHHRETDGFRLANSDVKLEASHARLALDATSASRWLLTVENYSEAHGEPGGLTFATGANAVNYNVDRRAASRLFDRFELDRRSVSLIWDRDLANGTVTSRVWATDYLRASKRQNGGGFGTLPTGAAANTNTIERQKFFTTGVESRVRLDWGRSHRHVFTAGAQFFHTDSPRTDSRGQSAAADHGDVLARSRRTTTYAPVFVENLFRVGLLSITPGFRLESIHQRVTETFNAAKQTAGVALGGADDRQTVPLLGLAVAYDFAAQSQIYLNVSQSYRPVVFTQAVPTGGTTLVPTDLAESRAVQYELGIRGQPVADLTFDASLFELNFDDQIGNIALANGLSTVGNVGRAVHRGAEASVSYNLLGNRQQLGRLEIYANAMLLHAKFTRRHQTGETPQLAPDHIVRTGLIYSRDDSGKISLLGTFTDRSFGDDGNSANRVLPASAVWDLTAEMQIPHSRFRLIGGINNLFDEDYYSRVTNSGIDPAPRRNYYLGASVQF